VSTKLGVLTNGIVYEFFVDSGEPNIMDEEPFLTLDLELAARVGVPDEVLDGLACITKETYDPDSIAEAAYVRLVRKRLRVLLAGELTNPSEDFCRFALRMVGEKHVRREAIEKYYAPMIKSAIRDVALLPSMRPTKSEASAQTNGKEEASDEADRRIVTTERELAVFAYVRRRLAFLIKEEAQFAAIDHIYYKDYLGKMRIYYRRELKGRLFDYIEGADGYDKFIFPDPAGAIVTNNLADIDNALKVVFVARFKSMVQGAPAARVAPMTA
jgi:predicted type IV restriction endonuclease